MQSILNSILDPNEKSIRRFGSLIGFLVTMYSLKVIEKQMKIFMDYLISANLLVDLIILILVFSILVYIIVTFNFRFKIIKILTVMLIVIFTLYTSHLTINQFTVTSLKLRRVSILPNTHIKSFYNKNVVKTNEKANAFSNNLTRIKSCKKLEFELLIRKNDSCRVKTSKNLIKMETDNSFLASNTFLVFIFRVILLVFAYLLAIRILIWLVIDLPEKKNDQISKEDEKTSKVEENLKKEIIFSEVKNMDLKLNNNFVETESLKRINFVKNIFTKSSQDHINIRKKIKRKHFDTAKTHSYSMDNLNKNFSSLYHDKLGAESLVSLESGNLQCYESSSSTTIASKKAESNLTLNSFNESENVHPKTDNINLVNWILQSSIDAKFSKMLFANFLNKTVQDLVSKTVNLRVFFIF